MVYANVHGVDAGWILNVKGAGVGAVYGDGQGM